jgi:hypothetical protein
MLDDIVGFSAAEVIKSTKMVLMITPGLVQDLKDSILITFAVIED